MREENYQTSISNYTKNNYLYNGKELQDDAFAGRSLNWYDYGRRFYDASLARFHTLDPLAEKYAPQSPYVYAANNPIIFVDVMGMGPGLAIAVGFTDQKARIGVNDKKFGWARRVVGDKGFAVHHAGVIIVDKETNVWCEAQIDSGDAKYDLQLVAWGDVNMTDRFYDPPEEIPAYPMMVILPILLVGLYLISKHQKRKIKT